MKNKKLLLLSILLIVAVFLCGCLELGEHQHRYSSKWTTNATQHWREATCGHEETVDLGDHSYGEPTDDVYTCTVCGYKTRNPLAGHVHTLTYVEATTPTLEGAGNVAYYQCSSCNRVYLDNTAKNQTTLEQTVLDKLTVQSLTLVSTPTKVSYKAGELFDATGIQLQATLSDDTTVQLTHLDNLVFSNTPLVESDTQVTVSYYNQSVKVDVTVVFVRSVSNVASLPLDTTTLVGGYYVGVSDEGPGADKEILIKDFVTDDVIAVRNVPYGSWPNVGYSYGDELQFTATVKKDTGNHTPNKLYLDFSLDNGEIQTTVVSTGNDVTYNLDNLVTVSSWDEMKQLFAVGVITEGTYVRFAQGVYLAPFTGGSDGVEVYYLHLNAQASGAASVKTDGTRAVSIRTNVMETNLGANWKSKFFADEPTGYVTRCNVEVVALFTGANGAYYQLTVLEDSWIKQIDLAYTNEEIAQEVAYAYYRQGNQVQYDQIQSRRNINPAPEEATAQDGLVLDCSSYVNAVYWEAFGVNVLPYSAQSKAPKTANFASYAKNNPNNPDVVGYWETKDYTTNSARKQLLDSIKAQLKPGDVLNYRRGANGTASSGHAMIYVGNDVWLHCTGSDYTYNSIPSQSKDVATSMEKNVGAIITDKTDAMFSITSTSNRYLFVESGANTIVNFCILRPIARGLTPTEKTLDRMLLAGLDAEKTVSVGENNAVYINQEVIYSVKLTNHTSTLQKGVAVTDVLPQGATFVSATNGCYRYQSNLHWTLDVPANSTVTVSYTVKLASKQSALLESKLATVNGMPINAIVNTVSGYTQQQMTNLASVVKQYASQSKGFTNPILMVSQAYKEALGVDLSYTKVSTVLSEVIDTSNNTCFTNTTATSMLVPNLYGGLSIKEGYTTDNDRARIVVESSLAVGDVIVATYNSGKIAHVYLYVGDKTLVEINSDTDVCKSVTISSNRYTNVLVTLVAYEKYAVIRPSMVA